ncbi:hypothetical protein CGLO_01849 [Colletotrichum gloeosporioides Cg-14]|uniref:Uncharacterized protein n=1 Tax=Colletotrichum gloeosporioides (strain Cg-14) TaxID=1237896 RepID=T0L0L7_COLGC|nr:hypothetical protein CGLO_01849 [Colletotrichum gloeosporioides Cg-14]
MLSTIYSAIIFMAGLGRVHLGIILAELAAVMMDSLWDASGLGSANSGFRDQVQLRFFIYGLAILPAVLAFAMLDALLSVLGLRFEPARNSPLTVAATGAAGSADGLFLQRPGLTFQPQPLTLQQRTAEETLTPITIFPSMPSRLREILNSPLAMRGWAVQERIWSTRVVHFATNSVEGECEGSRATEVNPAGLHPDDESYGWIGSWMIDEVVRLHKHDVGFVLRGWHYFVLYYITTNFTYQLDRLPVIVDLAGIVQERIGRDNRYMDRIWEGSILAGLSWRASGSFLKDAPGSVKNHMRKRGSLPSWSWASVREGMGFFSVREQNRTVYRR